MATEELLASIQVYQGQLEQIESAIASAGEEEKSQLQELQANLLQLLDLTLQQLSQRPTDQPQTADKHVDLGRGSQVTQSNSESSGENKTLDDEFALFKSEIADLEGSESPKAEPKYTKEELLAREGTNCRAPFVEKWGGHTYHSAVVLSVAVQEDGEIDLDDPDLIVLFSQPTCLDMLTCRFFLSGHCKFSDEKCRFSHGTRVSYSDIKEYKEPNMDSVVCGSRVLVQRTDDLWTNGTVQDILEDRSAFCVKFDHNKEVAEVKPNQLVPLHHAEDDRELNMEKEKKALGGDSSDSEESDDDQAVFVPRENWFQNSLSQRLGDWEKHTSGIASKLMEKMGYIVGTGLGPTGEGRVEPVTAYVYPQGVSLDRCMELREASNGEEILEVEKRLDRQRRIEEAKSIQAAERLRNRTSVFDIINKKLGAKGQEVEEDSPVQKQRLNVCKTVLQKDTNKDLNRKNYQLSANIRQLEREITKLEESKDRQSGNQAAANVIANKIQNKKLELKKAQDAERRVQGEQQNRKDAKKFCVF